MSQKKHTLLKKLHEVNLHIKDVNNLMQDRSDSGSIVIDRFRAQSIDEMFKSYQELCAFDLYLDIGDLYAHLTIEPRHQKDTRLTQKLKEFMQNHSTARQKAQLEKTLQETEQRYSETITGLQDKYVKKIEEYEDLLKKQQEEYINLESEHTRLKDNYELLDLEIEDERHSEILNYDELKLKDEEETRLREELQNLQEKFEGLKAEHNERLNRERKDNEEILSVRSVEETRQREDHERLQKDFNSLQDDLDEIVQEEIMEFDKLLKSKDQQERKYKEFVLMLGEDYDSFKLETTERLRKERQKYQELLRLKEQGEMRYSETLHRLQEDYDILQSQTDEKLTNQVRKYQDNEMRHMESLKKVEQKYDSLKRKAKHRNTHDEGIQVEGEYTSTGEEVKMLRERLDMLNKDYESLKLENHNRLTRETQNYQQLLENKLDQEKHYEKVIQEYDNLYSKFEDRVLQETQHKDQQINTLRSQFEESFKAQKNEQDKLNSLVHSQQLEITYLKSLIQDSEHNYRLPKSHTQDSQLSTQETSQIQKTSSALEFPYLSRPSQRYSIEQAPDGRHTISGTGDSKVLYWNFNPKSSGTLLKHGPKDWSLELSKGNKYMISTGDDGMVRVWNFSGSN